MPLLAYCMVEEQAEIAPPAGGVRSARIEEVREAGLRCFCSEFSPSKSATGERLKEDALRFHAVLREVFDQAAIIPFRFAGVFETEEQVRDHLRARGREYREALQRLRDSVQMELRIAVSPPRTQAAAPSGRDYLLERQAQMRALAHTADLARAAAPEMIRAWRVREKQEGWRCYALVARAGAADFAGRMRMLAPEEGVTIKVSGPWPATEFLNVGNEP